MSVTRWNLRDFKTGRRLGTVIGTKAEAVAAAQKIADKTRHKVAIHPGADLENPEIRPLPGEVWKDLRGARVRVKSNKPKIVFVDQSGDGHYVTLEEFTEKYQPASGRVPNPKRLFPGMSSEASLRDAGYVPCPGCGGTGVDESEFGFRPECLTCKGEGWVPGKAGIPRLSNPSRSRAAVARRKKDRSFARLMGRRWLKARKKSGRPTARSMYYGDHSQARGFPGDLKRGGKAINPGGPRIVYNRLLGGWYVVTGPHQTPLNGRFNSKAEAQAWLGRKNPRGAGPWKFTGRGRSGSKVVITVEREAIPGTPIQASSRGGYGQLHYATTTDASLQGVGIVLILRGSELEGWAVLPQADKESALREYRAMTARSNPRNPTAQSNIELAALKLWQLTRHAGISAYQLRSVYKTYAINSQPDKIRVMVMLEKMKRATGPQSNPKRHNPDVIPADVRVYVVSIRNRAKQDYAAAYAMHLLHGDLAPDTDDRLRDGSPAYPGLSYMAAQAVRMRLAELIPEPNPCSKRQHNPGCPCDPRCCSAVGDVCECRCRGAHHKSGQSRLTRNPAGPIAGGLFQLRNGAIVLAHAQDPNVAAHWLIQSQAEKYLHSGKVDAREFVLYKPAGGRMIYLQYVGPRILAGKIQNPQGAMLKFPARGVPKSANLTALERLRDQLEDAHSTEYRKQYPGSPVAPDSVTLKERRDFFALDIGGSGAFMVRKSDGAIFGIRGYGSPDYRKGIAYLGELTGYELLRWRWARGPFHVDMKEPRPNPSFRVSGTIEEIPDALPVARRGPGRPRKVRIAPVELAAELEPVPFEVPAEAPGRELQAGDRVTVPYSGRASYFGRAVKHTRESGIFEGYTYENDQRLAFVRVNRGHSVETHAFPVDQVRRHGKSFAEQAAGRRAGRPAKLARLTWKARGSLAKAEAMLEKATAEHAATEAVAMALYPQLESVPGRPQGRVAPASRDYLNARSKLRRLRERVDLLGSVVRSLGGGQEYLDPTGTDPWAANRRRIPNQTRHNGPLKNARTVRGASDKRNPRGSERERAVKTFRMWHEFAPHRVTRMKGPDRLIPRTLVKLGDIRSIDYISDKYEGRPVTYTHKTDRPRPVLATDPDGQNLHIIGGRVRITGDGLIH